MHVGGNMPLPLSKNGHQDVGWTTVDGDGYNNGWNEENSPTKKQRHDSDFNSWQRVQQHRASESSQYTRKDKEFFGLFSH